MLLKNHSRKLILTHINCESFSDKKYFKFMKFSFILENYKKSTFVGSMKPFQIDF